MNALVPYVFEGRALRTLSLDGEPWFVAGDAAAFLAYDHTPHLTRLLEADEKGVHTVDTLGGPQEVAVVSEPGLYRVMAQRRATSAIPSETRAFIARFQRWVFHDVLSSIRRTGSYGPEIKRIDPEIDRTDLNLRLVAQCQQTFDARAARRLWRDLDLPPVHFDEPSQTKGRAVMAPPSARAPRAPVDLMARAERAVRAAGAAEISRTTLYRRLDAVCRASQLDAALNELTRAGRITATRPAGATLGRPPVTYRWQTAGGA